MSYLFLEDGDLLEQVELDEILNEGLLNKLPQDIHKLKSNIKENIKELNQLKEKYNKNIILDICKKHDIKIISIQNERSHKDNSKVFKIYGIYKDYIIDALFIISINNEISTIEMSMVDIDYDENKCNIPKNIAFDILNNFSTYKIWRFKSGKDFIEVTAYSKSIIDSIFNKLENKYSKDYNIEKNLDGMSIKVYIKKE